MYDQLRSAATSRSRIVNAALVAHEYAQKERGRQAIDITFLEIIAWELHVGNGERNQAACLARAGTLRASGISHPSSDKK
jgi:hypothetical protein